MPTLDATKGGASANSYATVAEADAYLDGIWDAGEWTEVDQADKERLLITATKIIDGMPVKYDKADADQALKFPVNNTVDSDDDGFDEAKEVCICQALYLYKYGESIQEAQAGAIQGLRAESVSSYSKTVAGFNHWRQYCPAAALLRDYTEFVNTIYR
jgi:hypothetical protein